MKPKRPGTKSKRFSRLRRTQVRPEGAPTAKGARRPPQPGPPCGDSWGHGHDDLHRLLEVEAVVTPEQDGVAVKRHAIEPLPRRIHGGS